MDTLLAGLTSAQLTEWMAYAELEPFGPLHEDFRAGVIASAVMNCAFGRAKGSRSIRPEDLFDSLKKPTRRQAWQEIKQQLRQATGMMRPEKPAKPKAVAPKAAKPQPKPKEKPANPTPRKRA